jgi:hypothetical protein
VLAGVDLVVAHERVECPAPVQLLSKQIVVDESSVVQRHGLGLVGPKDTYGNAPLYFNATCSGGYGAGERERLPDTCVDDTRPNARYGRGAKAASGPLAELSQSTAQRRCSYNGRWNGHASANHDDTVSHSTTSSSARLARTQDWASTSCSPSLVGYR